MYLSPVALAGAPKTYTADATTAATEVAMPAQQTGAAQLVVINSGSVHVFLSVGALTGQVTDAASTGADRSYYILAGTKETISGGLGINFAKMRTATGSADVQFQRAIGI